MPNAAEWIGIGAMQFGLILAGASPLSAAWWLASIGAVVAAVGLSYRIHSEIKRV
jgi:hypothetical protein